MRLGVSGFLLAYSLHLMIASEYAAINFTGTEAFNHLLFTINQLLYQSDEINLFVGKKGYFREKRNRL